MKVIDIYDIANGTWYQQPTEDGPGTRTRGCAVVATASDSSSFNIYYYGGFDGIHVMEDFSDEVWVLSLPSFTWTKINSGTTDHARAGHKCFMPYPDQMMIFGGYPPKSSRFPDCLEAPIVLFNVSSGEWMDSYDPREYSEYSVPKKVQDKIGGDASGKATATEPSPSGWATPALAKVFETSYDIHKIKTYWPYSYASSTGRPDINDDGTKHSGKGRSGLPSWVAPVLGVVLGLMFVTGIVVLFCLWRRRKYIRSRSSEEGTEDPGSRILSWIKGQPAEKAPTVTTSDDPPASPEISEVAKATGTTTPAAPEPPARPAEMGDTQLVELAGM